MGAVGHLGVTWLCLSLGLTLGAQQSNGMSVSGRVLTPALVAGGGEVVLLFDDLNTSPAPTAWARTAVAMALKKHPPRSGWAVLTTSGTLRQIATTDVAALQKAVQAITSRSEQILPTQAAPLSGLTEAMHGGGSNDESLENHSRHSLDTYAHALAYAASLPGPATLIIISTGFPTDFPANGTNLETQVRALDNRARDSGVVVNAIDPAAIDPAGSSYGWQLQEGVLNGLTEATGGELADNRNELARALDDMAKNQGVETAVRKLRQALAGGTLNELPVEVVPRRWQPTAQAPDGVRLAVVVSAAGVRWERRRGRSRARLRVVGVLSSAQGHWVAAREGEAVLDVDGGTMKRLQRSGIQLGLELPASAGHYHLVIVVQRMSDGATTALAANLAVH